VTSRRSAGFRFSGSMQGATILGRVRVVLICVAVLVACMGTSFDARCESVFRRESAWPVLLNVAHAGASSLAPQNTLVAGQAALAVGADVWGVDVRRTKDGVFVLMHDETLERTTDVEARFPARSPWRVADFTLDEIRTLDAGSWFVEQDPFEQIAQGAVSQVDAASYAGEAVPTLREALDFVASHDWLMDIEVKAPFDVEAEVVAAELLSLLLETGTQDRVLISSFDWDFLEALRRVAPELAIGALAILPPPRTLAALQELQVDVYLPSVVGFTAALLADLEEAGIRVIVWTYNAEAQLQYAIGLPGIDGIYTDFPQRLAPLIAEGEP